MTTPEPPYIIRACISREMAFPVGYELLREHFGDLPEWIGARFYFCAHPTTFASEFSRILRACEPYCILRIEHRMAEMPPSYLPAHWFFTVYPVPRDSKSGARSALCRGPFTTLRDFITCAPTHANYYNRTDVTFDPQSGTCSTTLLWEYDKKTARLK